MTGMPFRKVFVPLIVCIVALSLSGAGAFAQGASSSFAVVVYLIEASNDGSRIDPEIKNIAKQLQGDFPYSAYKLVKKTPRRISVGKPETIPLSGGRELRLTASGYDNKMVKFNAEITRKPGGGQPPEKVKTGFRIAEGVTRVIWVYSNKKGKLIVAISVNK
jgi:hypothetical protein